MNKQEKGKEDDFFPTIQDIFSTAWSEKSLFDETKKPISRKWLFYVFYSFGLFVPLVLLGFLGVLELKFGWKSRWEAWLLFAIFAIVLLINGGMSYALILAKLEIRSIEKLKNTSDVLKLIEIVKEENISSFGVVKTRLAIAALGDLRAKEAIEILTPIAELLDLLSIYKNDKKGMEKVALDAKIALAKILGEDEFIQEIFRKDVESLLKEPIQLAEIPKGTRGMISRLELFPEKDELVACSYCMNLAKKEALLDWLWKDRSCPVCRRKLLAEDCLIVQIKGKDEEDKKAQREVQREVEGADIRSLMNKRRRKYRAFVIRFAILSVILASGGILLMVFTFPALGFSLGIILVLFAIYFALISVLLNRIFIPFHNEIKELQEKNRIEELLEFIRYRPKGLTFLGTKAQKKLFAIAALGDLKATEALPELIGVLQEGSVFEEVEAMQYVAWALAKIGTSQAVIALRKAKNELEAKKGLFTTDAFTSIESRSQLNRLLLVVNWSLKQLAEKNGYDDYQEFLRLF